MASKRTASSDLNHDNWDDDNEPEDAGTFKRASDDIIKQRVIKTARRRKPLESGEESATKNIFSNFSGFGKPAAPTTSDSPFAFLKTMSGNSESNKNGSSTFTSPSSTSLSINKAPMTFISPAKTEEKPKENGTTKNENKTDQTKNTEYYASLKGLNESVANWIKTHVDKNPFCILTPIFKDYEKYILEIEAKKEKLATLPSVDSNIGSEKNNLYSFNQTTPKTDPTPFTLTSAFPKPSEEKSPFSMALPTTAPKPTGFTFGTGAPFSFANVAKPPAEKGKPEEENTEDEPPKVEFVPVVEEDHIYTKRCKVFVKKDGNFGDRGVGQLFLKPVSGTEKVQLIVRADTNLGNLLLNFILSDSIPLQRMGKNNVMLVCIPTPDTKPPPVPILLRVKTAEEADELLKILEQNKK